MNKIKSIRVNKSLFFDDGFKIDFSEKMNCLMGGRGTGKTTLLYFIMTALQPNSENEKNPFNILKNNLGDGEIELLIELDDGKFVKVIKYFNEEPEYRLQPEDELVEFNQIRSKIKCDIFEASVIEEIGRNGNSRLELIDSMIHEEIYEKMNHIEDFKIDFKKNAQELKLIKEKIEKTNSKYDELKHIKLEFKNHVKKAPTDIDEKEDQEFQKQNEYERKRKKELKLLNSIISELNRIDNEIKERLINEKEFSTSSFENKSNYQNIDLIQECIDEFNQVLTLLEKSSKSVTNKIIGALKSLEKKQGLLKNKHLTQQNVFTQLKQKIEKHKEYYLTYNDLSKKEDRRKELEKELKILGDKKQKLNNERKIILSTYNQMKQEIYNLRLDRVSYLNGKFKDKIRIVLTFGGIKDEYENKLRVALKGSGLRYNELIPRIIENFNPYTFAKFVHEKDFSKIKSITGIDEIRSKAIIDALYDKDDLFEIESTYCPDLPEFLLKIESDTTFRKENYKKSDELSTGQRCTTVLPIVFAVSNNTLIIDQPEDNLDNKFISKEIYELINELKENRQLIFITHNPNIPVLPCSELNIFLNYDKKVSINVQGSVDDVKAKILELLEGGEEAFLERERIYGITRVSK